MVVWATASEARSDAISDIQTPRNGPTVAPQSANR